jgi:lipopolysaccharide heptosyltransferase II
MDPPDMAHKILRYAEEPELYRETVKNARKFVEENYSLDRMMKMTLETYTRALNTKNILVFKVSALGDIILSTPSLRSLRRKFPDANIKVLVDVSFREVLDDCPYIDEVITCDFKGRDRGIGFLKLAGRLRAEDFDISVDFQNNRKSHLLAFITAIPERYGYHNGKLSFLLNRKINPPVKAVDPVKHQKYVLGLLGITSMDNHLELWPKREGETWAERFLESNWLKKDQKLIAVSLSASRRWKTKNWDMTSFVELADMLAREKGARIVLIGTDEDEEYALEFTRRTGAKPINAIGRTNIPQLIGLVKRCDALLTADSAPMHVAAAVGTPFVALFGPTDPKRHLPPAGEHKVLRHKIRCSPCYKPTCKRKARCMSMIKIEEVFGALMEIMQNKTEKVKIKS